MGSPFFVRRINMPYNERRFCLADRDNADTVVRVTTRQGPRAPSLFLFRSIYILCNEITY